MSTDDNEILNIAIRLEYISHSVQSLYYNVSNRNLLRGILKKFIMIYVQQSASILSKIMEFDYV